MEQIRLEQLSIYYWLTDLLPDFVNVEDEYPTDELRLRRNRRPGSDRQD